jgi:hypothetical protein
MATNTKVNLFVPLVMALGLFAGCKPNNAGAGEKDAATKQSKYRVLPDSHGGTLDLIVVAKDPIWQGPAGEALRKHFTEMQYGLPQPEPRFQVNQVNPGEYNDLLQRTRYQILLSLGDSAVELQTNLHAKNQLIAYLSAPTELELAQLINAAQSDLRNKFRQKDLKRIYSRLKPKLQFNTTPVLRENHIKLGIPRGYDLEVEEAKTLLYWKKTAAVDKGILINFRPLPKDENILGSTIIPVRDSLTKTHLLGEKPNSYMVTETLLKPQLQAMELQGQFAMEARGLWRMEGDIFGGPFISYTIYDEKHNQIIYLDAFVFAPNQNKRNQLFELEALLKGVKIK